MGSVVQLVAAPPASGFSIFGARIGATLRHLASLDGQLSAARLLRGSALDERAVDASSENLQVVDAAGLLHVYEQALALTGRSDLGLCYGEAAGVTEYGPIGYAMLSAATDLEAVNIALTFQRLYYGTMASMSLHHEAGQGLIRLRENLPSGAGRRFFIEMLLAGFLRFNHALVGEQTQLQALRLAYPVPDYAERYRQLFQCEVHFGQPHHELLFDTGVLARPLPNADPITARACEQVCGELLERFDRGERFAARVRRVLLADGCDRGLRQVAASLGCHERTLHRRLQEEGTGFQQIKDDIQRDQVLVALQDTSLSINEVARRQGFDSPSNFRRAVRRWTGLAPLEWRRRLLGASGIGW
ncbi:AraC family transcriptional regulator [Parahaliea mediterranea]|uniref:AraC family transcriptional regulator n=1 Tax=Parahaliea mediterranea TaxID=651086 RepID=UPI000E2F2961|nr:AraC family transcriptional regulator [Parahaliea mediterranea]